MALIKITDLHKQYHLGRTTIDALKGISFDIEAGDFITILGPSGCGKTTLLNLIGSIDDPSSGSILFEDQNICGLSDNRKSEIRLTKIGFIFQSFNLIPVLNVRENIEFPMILANAPPRTRTARIDELVETVGLKDFELHKPDELSGGQRQRVAIARALVNRPKLVIADEPTANLDSVTGTMIIEEMKALNEQEKVTFVFSTHNQDVMKYAKRIIRLKDGAIVS